METDIFDTIKKYMSEGLTETEAIVKAQQILRTQFSPDIRDRIHEEVSRCSNF